MKNQIFTNVFESPPTHNNHAKYNTKPECLDYNKVCIVNILLTTWC